jgi:hypothetical protein
LEEVIYVEKDEKGSVILELLGVDKVLDPMLLEEIINFNDDGNFDRIIAAELALAYANILTPIVGPIKAEKDERFKSYFNVSTKPSRVFNTPIRPFSKSRKTLFR